MIIPGNHFLHQLTRSMFEKNKLGNEWWILFVNFTASRALESITPAVEMASNTRTINQSMSVAWAIFHRAPPTRSVFNNHHEFPVNLTYAPLGHRYREDVCSLTNRIPVWAKYRTTINDSRRDRSLSSESEWVSRRTGSDKWSESSRECHAVLPTEERVARENSTGIRWI